MVRQERALRTRRALLRAAAEAFAEEGFVPASLSAISKRAGVTNGALHFHFASKNALAESVVGEAAETIRRITEDARARQSEALQEVVDATHDLMAGLAQDIVVRGGFVVADDSALHEESPLRRQWQHWIEDNLRRAERSGALAPGVSWVPCARAIVAATTGLEVLGRRDAAWLSRETVTGLWELLLPRLADRRQLDMLACGGSRPPLDAPPQ